MTNVPKLIALSEQLRGKTFELSEDRYKCGRVEDNDIYINDPTISSHHCEFIRKGNTFVIHDNNSTNGTRVNNIPVVEQELQNSDILQIGGIEFFYDSGDKSVTTVIRTQTNISLDDSDMDITDVKSMRNFSPFASSKGDGKTQKVVILIVAVLVVLIILLLAYLFHIMNKDEGRKNLGSVNKPTTTAHGGS